mgnify:CR=1 FL=1
MPNKKNISQVKELSDVFSTAKAVYFTKYQGLDVSSITKLRSDFFKNNVEYKVAKNSLLKIVVKENKYPNMDEILKGDTAIAITYDEPVTPAKVLKKFIKENDLPTIKGIIIDGNLISVNDFEKLANMESKELLLGKLVLMLNSPLQKLVSTLNAPMQNLVGVLINLKNKS